VLSCPVADARVGGGCVRLFRPSDIPTDARGKEAARVIAGARGRVAREVLFACAEIRSAAGGRDVRAASNPGPRERGLWRSTASQTGLETTGSGARRRGHAAETTDRPEWPWVELVSWGSKPSTAFVPARRPCCHAFGFAARGEKFTLPYAGSEFFFTRRKSMHVPCRAPTKVRYVAEAASRRACERRPPDGFMEGMTIRCAISRGITRANGKFCQTDDGNLGVFGKMRNFLFSAPLVAPQPA